MRMDEKQRLIFLRQVSTLKWPMCVYIYEYTCDFAVNNSWTQKSGGLIKAIPAQRTFKAAGFQWCDF